MHVEGERKREKERQNICLSLSSPESRTQAEVSVLLRFQQVQSNESMS